MPGVADRPRGQVGKQRSDERACRAARGDDREKPLRCPESNSSTMKLQKTETKNRLRTLMKT
jgi:hypothetical protein